MDLSRRSFLGGMVAAPVAATIPLKAEEPVSYIDVETGRIDLMTIYIPDRELVINVNTKFWNWDTQKIDIRHFKHEGRCISRDIVPNHPGIVIPVQEKNCKIYVRATNKYGGYDLTMFEPKLNEEENRFYNLEGNVFV